MMVAIARGSRQQNQPGFIAELSLLSKLFNISNMKHKPQTVSAGLLKINRMRLAIAGRGGHNSCGFR